MAERYKGYTINYRPLDTKVFRGRYLLVTLDRATNVYAWIDEYKEKLRQEREDKRMKISIPDKEAGGMLDISDPEASIEIAFEKDGSKMWVNVDGICRLRVSRIPDRNDKFEISLVYPSDWNKEIVVAPPDEEVN